MAQADGKQEFTQVLPVTKFLHTHVQNLAQQCPRNQIQNSAIG